MLTLSEAMDTVARRVERGEPTLQVSLNAAKYVRAAHDPVLARFIRRAHLVNADGAGVLLAARRFGLPVPERIPGVDLMMALLPVAARRGWPVFFLGAKPQVLSRAVQVAQERWPGLVVAGWRDGYFRPEEEAAVADQIRQSGARLLFVAMGTPRQERFLERWFDRTGCLYGQGVGGGFDVLAGVVQRAPRWVQRAGLEGFYRLLLEPRKRWRRVVVDNLRFLVMVARGSPCPGGRRDSPPTRAP